ncbi:uncharacterized protein LOC9658935 isoform X1 [Selaginella moellendorffii]|uniref:uncharacterized protein LOC9658935 isoform X1 n=1 Tax=Selaginella moellendorffii TaxID=88036 RepID=UPI000D1C54F9|nr:uncharacterized protein LOC9658935 isoform X1 [Selaginella moellendorffii]|eukprot:XP_024539535.1 uncharacterized protein LOC9658935 isoform X1 [Selaginella moellendorffii]
MAVTTKGAALESCSVCLEQVSDVGERSFAKLKCGHYFHLDCIGSAFNAKGSMQCPNCRRVEEGRWLYASGCRQHEDFAFVDLPSSDEEYDVYAGMADYHELHLRHFQWCPYQSFLSLEEIDPLVTGYSDPNVVVNVLYGENHPAAPTNSNTHHVCPFFSPAQSYWGAATRQIVDELVVVQNQVEPPSVGGGGGGGGSIGGTIRGPHSFPVHERTGWASQSGGAHNPVGMMNDVGLASLPIERFRWSAPANRSDAVQPGYSGQLRSPENNATSWHHVPCPHHGLASTNVSSSPAYAHGNGPSRRSRHWAHGTSSSTGRVGAGSRVASPREQRESHHREWQRRRESPGYETMVDASSHWRPWFQSGSSGSNFSSELRAAAASGSVRADVYGPSDGFQGQHYYYSQSYAPPGDEARHQQHHHHHHHAR